MTYVNFFQKLVKRQSQKIMYQHKDIALSHGIFMWKIKALALTY